jgi:hypothetical protein
MSQLVAALGFALDSGMALVSHSCCQATALPLHCVCHMYMLHASCCSTAQTVGEQACDVLTGEALRCAASLFCCQQSMNDSCQTVCLKCFAIVLLHAKTLIIELVYDYQPSMQ